MIPTAKQVLKAYGEDKVGQLSAALSYFTLFSIGPLLLVLVSVAGFVLGDKAASGELGRQLASAFGSDTADTIQQVVANSAQTHSGVIGLIIGLVTLVLGASGLFGQLHSSFNQIFKVQADPGAGWVNFVWPRLKGVLLLGLVCILVVASVVASALISALGKQAEQYIGFSHLTLQLINFSFSTLVIGLLLSLIYRTLPDVVLPNRVIVAVGLLIGVFFSLGKALLGFVIGQNGAASAYGAAAALITLLLWVFYFGQIIFLGAEIIKVYGERHGHVFPPKKFAVKQKSAMIRLSRRPTVFLEAFQRGFEKRRSKK